MEYRNHSSYWLDMEDYDDDADNVEAKLIRLTRLASLRRAVSNFVSIMTGRTNIPVKFSSGKESYTDGETVVISAEDNPKRFDSMVGLALHEASHILLTDFLFLDRVHVWRGNMQRRIVYPKKVDAMETQYSLSKYGWTVEEFAASLPMPLRETMLDQYVNDKNTYELVNYCRTAETMINDIWTIMNILEDRRIDKWVYANAQGYRPYYDALYQKHFFTKEIGRNLRNNPEWKVPSVQNYINRLLFSFHPDNDPGALPGLRDMIAYMDIDTIDRLAPENDVRKNGQPLWTTCIDYEATPKLYQAATYLYMHILKHAIEHKETPTNFDKLQPKHLEKLTEDLHDLPNLDHRQACDQPSGDKADADKDTNTQAATKPTKKKLAKNKKDDTEFNSAKGAKDAHAARQIVDGDARKKRATKEEQTAADALETADAKLVDIHGHGIPHTHCMVLKRVSEQLLQQNWFVFRNSRLTWGSEAYKKEWSDMLQKGKRMGQILAHRLQIRNDPVYTKSMRLPSGTIEKRLLAQLGMDITSVFQRTKVDSHKPAMLHLTLDASGSMQGEKWQAVGAIAIALAYVSSKIRNIDVIISMRGGDAVPMVCVLYDSRKDTFNQFVRKLNLVEPHASTPESLCFRATMDLILENATTHQVYFINFSDGEPSFVLKESRSGAYIRYADNLAVTHTRHMMQILKENNITVLSYFLWDKRYKPEKKEQLRLMFKKMYGDEALFIDVTQVTELLRTLNKRLSVRG